MVVETGLRGLRELEVLIEVGTMSCVLVGKTAGLKSGILEFLFLINNLYPMFVLLSCWRIADIGEMAVHGHD